jgi:hypothetical protein
MRLAASQEMPMPSRCPLPGIPTGKRLEALSTRGLKATASCASHKETDVPFWGQGTCSACGFTPVEVNCSDIGSQSLTNPTPGRLASAIAHEAIPIVVVHKLAKHGRPKKRGAHRGNRHVDAPPGAEPGADCQCQILEGAVVSTRRVERLIGPLQVSRELLKAIACSANVSRTLVNQTLPLGASMHARAHHVSRKTYLRCDHRPSGFSSGAFRAFVNRLRLPK